MSAKSDSWRLCRLAAAFCLVPGSAWAHPGHDGAGGLIDGLAHPLTGLDHLSAMVLMGLWSGLLVRRSRAMLLVPLAFIAAMALGFASGVLFGLGLAEPLIVASLLALGAAAVLRLQAPLPLAAGAAALFGFAHGQAHGVETPAGAAPLLFAAGFLITSAALQVLGLRLARFVPGRASTAVSAG